MIINSSWVFLTIIDDHSVQAPFLKMKESGHKILVTTIYIYVWYVSLKLKFPSNIFAQNERMLTQNFSTTSLCLCVSFMLVLSLSVGHLLLWPHCVCA